MAGGLDRDDNLQGTNHPKPEGRGIGRFETDKLSIVPPRW